VVEKALTGKWHTLPAELELVGQEIASAWVVIFPSAEVFLSTPDSAGSMAQRDNRRF
jgi:hypothetical protein